MRPVLVMAVSCLIGSVASAAVTVAPGWALRTVVTPDVVQGGVVARDGAVIVGQGSFGAGRQRVVRLRGSEVVTIATGFNALGGFALAADGTLYVVDNAGDLPGTTSGDTVYAITEALQRTDAITAASAEIAPSGSLPFAQDVLALTDGRLVVSESVGPGVGRIAVLDGSTVSTLVPGLDYASGLALQGSTLLLANVDASFAGAVRRFALDGSEQPPLASSLSGAFALAVDGDGQVLVSGGFAEDFTSTVVAIDGQGTVAERARGFAFTTELFYDALADETLVLDAGASAVTSICRDRDGDGLCDLSTACTDPAALDARIRTGVVRGSLPGAARYLVSARLGLAGNVARAEPKQSGLTLRTVAPDGVLIDLVIPGGSDWRRTPTGGWSYRAPAGALLRAKVRIEKDEAFVRVVTPGTLYATTEARTIVALGALCGSEGERCLVKGTPRRRPRIFRLSCS